MYCILTSYRELMLLKSRKNTLCTLKKICVNFYRSYTPRHVERTYWQSSDWTLIKLWKHCLRDSGFKATASSTKCWVLLLNTKKNIIVFPGDILPSRSINFITSWYSSMQLFLTWTLWRYFEVGYKMLPSLCQLQN